MRKRVLALVVVGVLATASAAFAAWQLYSGISGTASGTVGSATTIGAITITPDCNSADGANCTSVVPGSDGTVYAKLTNNDPNSAHYITALSASSITADNGCNTSALSFTVNSGLIGPGGSINNGGVEVAPLGTLHAASNLDPNCQNANLTISLTGTTSP